MEALEAIASRRSIRRYAQKPVPESDIATLIEAARLAPSARNGQTLRLVVARRDKGLVRSLFELTSWGGAVKPRRSPSWGVDAPTAFIAVSAPRDSSTHVRTDAGAALENMSIAAGVRGVGSCWRGAFDDNEAARILGLASDREVLYLLAVGYPAENPVAEPSNGKTTYYLDADDRLHVPKLTAAVAAEWR
ncbi:MAG: nitroreductase family protein [Victivallaceae bacterium]|nr:nitroreductase family protein [Victivallaceae bacterium]